MPFTNGGITAKSAEEYKNCEENLVKLNSLVETLNYQSIPVKILPHLLGKGCFVTPVSFLHKINQLRIASNYISWVDFNAEKKTISIRCEDSSVFIINCEPDK